MKRSTTNYHPSMEDESSSGDEISSGKDGCTNSPSETFQIPLGLAAGPSPFVFSSATATATAIPSNPATTSPSGGDEGNAGPLHHHGHFSMKPEKLNFSGGTTFASTKNNIPIVPVKVHPSQIMENDFMFMTGDGFQRFPYQPMNHSAIPFESTSIHSPAFAPTLENCNTNFKSAFHPVKNSSISNYTGHGLSAYSLSKKRHKIASTALNEFEKYFQQDPKPDMDTIKSLAEKYGEDFSKVKIWFNNRRGKEQKLLRKKELQDSLGLSKWKFLLEESIKITDPDKKETIIPLSLIIDEHHMQHGVILDALRQKILDLQGYIQLLSSYLADRNGELHQELLEKGILKCFSNEKVGLAGSGIGTASGLLLRSAHLKKLTSKLLREISNSKIFPDQLEKEFKVFDFMTRDEFLLVFLEKSNAREGEREKGKDQKSQKFSDGAILNLIFGNRAQVSQIYGGSGIPFDGMSVSIWSRGGLPVCRKGESGAGNTFSKSEKIGISSLLTKSLEAIHNRNSLRVSLKLICQISKNFANSSKNCKENFIDYNDDTSLEDFQDEIDVNDVDESI